VCDRNRDGNSSIEREGLLANWICVFFSGAEESWDATIDSNNGDCIRIKRFLIGVQGTASRAVHKEDYGKAGETGGQVRIKRWRCC